MIGRKAMSEETVNVAEAKKHFSELLGRVAFGKKHILITKRGKPMARLVPADQTNIHLSDAKGWLEDDDPFFDAIDRIIQDRSKHAPRILKEPEPR
jgi:prevent-host-death family protein